MGRFSDLLVDRLCRAGRDLFDAGLVSTRAGNLSVRVGEAMLITRTGASLAHLDPGQVVEVPVHGPGPKDGEASSDLAVHRRVYQLCGATAVVHAHPTAAVVLSFGADEIVPADLEGRTFVPAVPVVEDAGDVPGRIASGAPVVVARAHGSYAAGPSIEEAVNLTTAVEASARILLLLRFGDT